MCVPQDLDGRPAVDITTKPEIKEMLQVRHAVLRCALPRCCAAPHHAALCPAMAVPLRRSFAGPPPLCPMPACLPSLPACRGRLRAWRRKERYTPLQHTNATLGHEPTWGAQRRRLPVALAATLPLSCGAAPGSLLSA